jgi:hypothetical protein
VVFSSGYHLEFDLEGLGLVEGGANRQQTVVCCPFGDQYRWYLGNSLHFRFWQEEIAEAGTAGLSTCSK